MSAIILVLVCVLDCYRKKGIRFGGRDDLFSLHLTTCVCKFFRLFMGVKGARWPSRSSKPREFRLTAEWWVRLPRTPAKLNSKFQAPNSKLLGYGFSGLRVFMSVSGRNSCYTRQGKHFIQVYKKIFGLAG